MSIHLRELTEHDEHAFLEGAKLWAPEDITWYSFDWKPGAAFKEMLSKLADNREGRNLPPQFVPSTMLYAFDKNGEIVGRLNIRHHLNESLEKRGGHVGYAVAEKYRGQGYATEIMKQGLAHCSAKLGLKEILVTCADTNIPSWKIIERHGGKLENKVFDDDGKETIRRYRIAVG